MSKSRFRLIALKAFMANDNNIIGKVRSIQKKTFGRGWLYFGSSFELFDGPKYTSNQHRVFPFYGYKLNVKSAIDVDEVLYDCNGLCISVNALVGANGSGKSSIVDMILRILNNLAVTVMGETRNYPGSEHLYFIEDVYGCLVYQIAEEYYQITCSGRSVRIGQYNYDECQKLYVCERPRELLSQKAREDKYNPIEHPELDTSQLQYLFYTAIFNYSLYAFNFNDYYNERTLEDRWRGTSAVQKDYDANYDGKFTQDSVWLNGLFHKNDGYQTPIVLNPMRENGIINVNVENKLAVDRILSKLLYENEESSGHGNQPSFPFRYINEHLEIVALKITPKKYPKFSKDNVLRELGYTTDCDIAHYFDAFRKDLVTIWSNIMQMPYAADSYHNIEDQLAWDYIIYKTLKICKSYIQYENLLKDVFHDGSYNKSALKTGLIGMSRDESHVTLKLRRALYFLKYNHYAKRDGNLVNLYDVYASFKHWRNLYEEMNIKIDNGRILINRPAGWRDSDLPRFETDKLGHLNIHVPYSKNKPLPLMYVEDNNFIAKQPDHEEVILPPIFDMKMMLIERNKVKPDGSFDKNDLIPFEGLSSGEKQLAYSISNIAYQLSNINSVAENKNKVVLNITGTDDKPAQKSLLKYKHVNVILDEIELYFHPDLQRRYTKCLLDAISNLGLKNIEGIGVLMISHSPFILSDIPDCNILCLDNDGKRKSGKTFGGNIHEMLADTFFMESAIGDYAENLIAQFISVYHEKDANKRRCEFVENKVKFGILADIIADPYLREEINDMYFELCNQYSFQTHEED